MKKLKVIGIKIANFKAIHSFEDTLLDNVSIVGANGTGKSSIVDAIHWCLFGCNANGKEFKVRPLDENNEVVPNLRTEVEISLSVNGADNVTTFKRGLSERKIDNTTSYFVNGVPCNMREFNEKITEIVPIDVLKTLTSISAFFSMETKAARKVLQQMAGELPEEFSDEKLAKDYPAVTQALTEGKNLDELKRAVTLAHKEAKKELDTIADQINAQDRIRPDVAHDFDALRVDAKMVENKIESICTKLEQSGKAHDVKFSTELGLKGQLHEKRQELLDISSSCDNERGKRKRAIESAKSKAEEDKAAYQTGIDRHNTAVKKEEVTRDSDCDTRDNLIAQWREVNQSVFNADLTPMCSECNKPYTAEELSTMEGSQIERFNKTKLSKLNTLKKDIGTLTSGISVVVKVVIELTEDITEFKKEIASCDTAIKKAERDLKELPTLEIVLEANKEHSAVKLQVEELEAQIKQQAVPSDETSEKLRADRESLKQTLEVIKTKLTDEALIARIEKEKSVLEKHGVALAQIKADNENVEDQIKGFQKRKIAVIEERIASLFTLIKFKMYEANLRGDGEKEICECLVDGVPYANLNTASRVNAGIDCCNAYGKSIGVIAPIFIDNKESVTHLISTDSQLITLKVVDDSELTVINK